MLKSITRTVGYFHKRTFTSHSFYRRNSTYFDAMKIGTHDGVFHCDEVLACYMLKLLPEYKDAEIVRSRDPSKLQECDIVVDVGAVFDHKAKRYDHHQKEFYATLSSLRPLVGSKFQIRLSSAGLIYAFYGDKVIEALMPDIELSDYNKKVIYKKIYKNLIEEIDAIDNGVPMTNEEPRYKIRTDLSCRVHRLNPEWNSDQHIDVNEQFKKALEIVGEEFNFTVKYFMTVWLPARDFVRVSLEQRADVHESGQILIFKGRFPWKEHLFDFEEELLLGPDIKYVIYNDKPNSWRVQAVPITYTSFVSRKPLNKQWWGIRDDKLSEVSGIKECIFCHSTGFIGGNRTKEGALAMAISSLEADY